MSNLINSNKLNKQRKARRARLRQSFNAGYNTACFASTLDKVNVGLGTVMAGSSGLYIGDYFLSKKQREKDQALQRAAALKTISM